MLRILGQIALLRNYRLLHSTQTSPKSRNRRFRCLHPPAVRRQSPSASTESTSPRTIGAAELLQLAGLSPEDHDLARLADNSGVEHRFVDDEEIQITPRARFISIFTGSTPVA